MFLSNDKISKLKKENKYFIKVKARKMLIKLTIEF